MSQTVDVLRKVIAKQAKIDESAITRESTLDELGLMSLDLIEIIMNIEDEYDVTIPLDANQASKQLRTFDDLVKLAESLDLGGKQA